MAFPLETIRDHPPSDAEDPGGKGGLATERIQAGEDRDEDLLGRLFYVGADAHSAIDKAVNALEIAIVK